jgi:hypothetical protein
MVQVSFLRILGRPDGKTLDNICNEYNQRLGRPSAEQRNAMKREINYSYGFDFYRPGKLDDFFDFVQASRQSPSDLVDSSVRLSMKSNYFRDSRSLEECFSKIRVSL